MGKYTAGSEWKTRGGWKAVVVKSTKGGLMVDHGESNDGTWAHETDGTYAGIRRDFDLIAEWTEPAEPRGVAHLNPKDGDRFVCTWTEREWWTVGKVYAWNGGLISDNGCPGMIGGDATFRRADPEPVVAAAVPDRAVPLPAAVTFYDVDGYAVELSGSGDTVRLAVKYDDDMVGYPLTPATARALGYWLTVFADAADAGEGGE